MTEDRRKEERVTKTSYEVRTDAYQRVREVLKDIAEVYYTKFPERAVDQRSSDNRTAMVEMLTGIFTVLNDYELVDRRPRS